MRPIVCLSSVIALALGAGAVRAELALEPCRLATGFAPAVFASCARLEVPEDPTQPDGPTLELFAARVPASTATPRPDPLLIITGGPGQSAVDFYLQTRPAFEQVRRDRELILLDQRGTGRSADGFSCSVPVDLSVDTADDLAIERYVRDCLAELERDPRLFTTSVAVRDLERLREALGVEVWNVYGVSYGTRVAQHYLRRYPERTRALILDGVVPADLVLGPDIARHAQQALDAIFARCEADPACAERFGNLPARFRALQAELEAAPASGEVLDVATGRITSQPLTRIHLQAVVRLMSYSAPTAALLPLLIAEANDGNVAPLARQAQALLRDLPEALSFPMHNSVVCTEDYPFFDGSAAYGAESFYLGTTIVDGLERICRTWPRGEIDPDFKAPVVADRPVLLLSGENDPITPPELAEHAIAGGLTNAKHVIARGQGHGLAPVGCVPRLLRVFLERPEPAALDAGCVGAESPTPFFLTFLGPAP